MTQKYEPTWESLQQYEIPEWYINAKFGIFIHWGVYAVPAFGNEWYPRRMYLEGSAEYEHHRKTYGSHTLSLVTRILSRCSRQRNLMLMNGRNCFKDSGARFVMPVAEHHDGFPLYDSDLTEWSSVKMGPKRDIIGELAEATRKQGMIFSASSHRAEHWWFMNGGREFPSDVQDPQYDGLYGPAAVVEPEQGTPEWKGLDWRPRPDAKFLEDWLARCCELVDKYQPQVVWFDWWIEQAAFEPYIQRFAAYYYNRGEEWGKGVAINYKNEAFPEGTAVYDIERGQLSGIRPIFWQTDTSVSKNSWGYIDNHDYKTAGDIVGDLVDIVSKNGALLLNIGPRADGTIPEPEQAMLRQIGQWLAVNGEAIYDTRHWEVFGEGPTKVSEGSFTDTERPPFTGQDIRFTQKGNILYAICLGWPQGEVQITSLGSASSVKADQIAGVSMLGSSEVLTWSQDANALRISAPSAKPCDYAYTFRIDLKG